MTHKTVEEEANMKRKLILKNGAKVNSKERRKYKGFKSQDREVGTKKYGQ